MTLRAATSTFTLVFNKNFPQAIRLATTNYSRLYSTASRLLAPERRFSDKHEWISKDGNIGTVGISNYAQEALGDVVFVQLPDLDTEVKKDEDVGAVESVKAASEVYSPVSGKVIEINKALEDKPGLVNSSPMDQGWLFKLQLTNTAEFDQLMNNEQYADFVKKAKQ